jgi:hypothetical protein
VNVIPAYEPARYLEYSECFDPSSKTYLSDNMITYGTMAGQMMKCKEDSHAISEFKVYKCNEKGKSSWHQFRFVCQPLLNAKKNAKILPYTSTGYSPTTYDTLTYNKDLFLGSVTANIKFHGKVIKMADPAAVDANVKSGVFEKTMKGCECLPTYTYNNKEYTKCTRDDWPVAWCATPAGCDYKGSALPSKYWDDCLPAEKNTVEPSDYTPGFTQIAITATGVNPVHNESIAWVLPKWANEKILSLTIQDEKGISNKIQVPDSKPNEVTTRVHAELHFKATGSSGFEVEGTIPEVMYTGYSTEAAKRFNSYAFLTESKRRTFDNFTAENKKFVASGKVYIKKIGEVESDFIEIDAASGVIKATSFYAKSIDFSAPKGEWMTRSAVTVVPDDEGTGTWTATIAGFNEVGNASWIASANSMEPSVKIETEGPKPVRFAHENLDVDIFGFEGASSPCSEKAAFVAAAGTVMLNRGVFFPGRADGTADPLPTVAVTFPVMASISCNGTSDSSKAEATASIASYEITDNLYLKDVAITFDMTVRSKDGGFISMMTSFDGKVDLSRSITGIAFHYGELDVSFRTSIKSVTGAMLQSDIEEELLGRGSFVIETGPPGAPDMMMFVKMSSGVALPCPDGTKAPASGYVSINMHGGMVRVEEDNVMMTVLCGYDKDYVNKPRVVAKSVLKMNALFDDKYVAKIYKTLQELAFDTVEVTIAAIQGDNGGWYWNMDVTFVLTMDTTHFKLEYVGTIGFSSRFGLPSENTKISVDFGISNKYFSFNASGVYVIGAMCRSSDSERGVELFGALKLKDNAQLMLPPFTIDIKVTKGCPQYEDDESNDKYATMYTLEGNIEGYEIVPDMFVINKGNIIVNLQIDQDMQIKGFFATFEGNVSAMYEGSDPELPFDMGASADLWITTSLEMLPVKDGEMPEMSIGPIEFNALISMSVSASTGDENSTDVSGFSLTGQVRGYYPCITGQQFIGALNMRIKISDKFAMDFGLEGHITFNCGVTDATKPKLKASVYVSVALDFIPGLVIDSVAISVIAFHDVDNDAWNLQGTVGGSVLLNNLPDMFGDDAGVGVGVRFTFDTRSSYWSMMSTVTYTSDSFNITVAVGTESGMLGEGNCTEQGSFVDGTIDLILPVPSYEAKKESVPAGSGSFTGVMRCNEAAKQYGKYQLSASVETLMFEVGPVVIYIHDLQFELDVMIPDGKEDGIAFEEHDFYFRIVGRILLQGQFEFPGAEILNALVPEVGIDLFGEIHYGEEFNPDEHMNLTMYTIMNYRIEADEESWQKKDGVDKLFIWAYLRIAYPCPFDGIMAGLGFVFVHPPSTYIPSKNPKFPFGLSCVYYQNHFFFAFTLYLICASHPCWGGMYAKSHRKCAVFFNAKR